MTDAEWAELMAWVDVELEKQESEKKANREPISPPYSMRGTIEAPLGGDDETGKT